jgi:uncharacterized membrane protein YphA (DoxX/SURF4 family)
MQGVEKRENKSYFLYDEYSSDDDNDADRCLRSIPRHDTLSGMLNPFPIQFLAPLTYFLLRVVLGFLIIRLGNRLLRRTPRTAASSVIAGIEIVIGSMFILGVYTQIAAFITILLTIPVLARPHSPLRVFQTNRSTTLLMCVIALSLFITGAGAFAFDLPI